MRISAAEHHEALPCDQGLGICDIGVRQRVEKIIPNSHNRFRSEQEWPVFQVEDQTRWESWRSKKESDATSTIGCNSASQPDQTLIHFAIFKPTGSIRG
jgi:hypothetical protein